MKDKSIKRVLELGSGPIRIGQAAEFDYAGSQACRALKEEGCEVILLNSNPATIQTDLTVADIVCIKPDGTGNYGEREVETNMVLSVYSRQNFIRYFALLRDMDAFVFVSGRKIEALEDLSALPLAGNCSGLDIDRILQRPKCLG